jgi:hypothetical protein
MQSWRLGLQAEGIHSLETEKGSDETTWLQVGHDPSHVVFLDSWTAVMQLVERGSLDLNRALHHTCGT